MAAVQVAQAPSPDEFEIDESTGADAATAPPQKLTLEQTLRIMDVATTLRKEQAVVQQQLNLEETKAMLRRRLLDAAKITGEKLTEEQVDIAIEHYYDKLHVFEQPEWSLELTMAHLYVMRNKIIGWTIAIGATAGILTWFW
ncbi:MAG: DUF6384 family protein [Bythopirellula sp.]